MYCKTPNNLYGKIDESRGITLLAGVNYLAGSVLSSNAGGVYELKALAETAGELVCVLKESVDATAASKPAVGIFAGDVNSAKLIFGGGQTFAQVQGILQRAGINAKTWRES